LGISKLPVREAFILRENEGLVDNLPRRGSYVAALTPDDIKDNYQLIALVSGLAARRHHLMAVAVGADAGEHRHLLPAKSGHAPQPTGDEADGLGPHKFPVGHEEARRARSYCPFRPR
jgi:hypothetical protein